MSLFFFGKGSRSSPRILFTHCADRTDRVNTLFRYLVRAVGAALCRDKIVTMPVAILSRHKAAPTMTLSTTEFSPRLCGAWALVFLISGATVPSTLLAAKAAKDAKDSAPVLMSRTGGGDSWADVKELKQAAEKGNPKAEAQLGEMLLRGDSMPKDEVRAVALLEKAARAGHSGAAFRIAMLLAGGESGVAKDPVRALAYFQAAAAGGEAEAFFNIGAVYANGRGVKRDYAEALGWLIIARQRGADASAEKALRTQIKARTDWIATGERRAKEIEAQFTGKKVTDFLPPAAPLNESVAAAASGSR
jgi:hypothetical protein